MDAHGPVPLPNSAHNAEECHAAAAAVERTLVDLGLVVRRRVERTAFDPAMGHSRRSVEVIGGDDALAVPADEEPPGVTITVVEHHETPLVGFFGVHVDWELAPRVSRAAADAMSDLIDRQLDGPFVAPTVWPEPITRQGKLLEIATTAIRAALALDGFATRDDTDYQPFGLWLVLEGS